MGLSYQEGFPIGKSPMFSEATVDFTQQLPFPGKLKAQKKTAQALSQMEAVRFESIRRSVVFKVRDLYAQLYALDKENRYLSAAHKLLKLISDATAARYSTGQLDQEAVVKSQLALSRLTERRDDVGAERKILVSKLNGILDRPGDQPLGEVVSLPDVQQFVQPDDTAVKEVPDVKIQMANIAAAQSRIVSAKKDVWPDFLVGLGAGAQTNPVDNKIMPMAMLQFGITLPIWQSAKQRPLIQAANEDLNSAQATLRESEAATRSTFVSLAVRQRRNQRQIHLYREAILPQTQAAMDAARFAYMEGSGDFSTLIEDFNLWLESRIELARRESDLYSAWAEMESLSPSTAQSKGAVK